MKKIILSITAILFLNLSCQKENNLLNIPAGQDIELSKSNGETNADAALSGARTRNLCDAGFVLELMPPNRVIAGSPLRDTTINHYWAIGDTSPVRTTRMVRHMFRPGTYTIRHIIVRPAITSTGPSCTDTVRFTLHVPFQRARRIVVR